MGRRGVAWVLVAVMAAGFAACGSGGGKAQSVRFAADTEASDTVTTSGAEPGDGTTTTTLEEPTTVAPEVTTTTVPPVTITSPRQTPTTARRLVSNSTPSPSSTTTAAPATTTTVVGVTTTSQEGATTTTKPIETVAALTIGQPGKPPNAGTQRAIPEGLDFAKLASDLAAQGYQTGKVHFRGPQGEALADPIEQNVNDTRATWKAMFDGAGGKKVAGLLTTDGSAGSHAFADLVVAQIDAIFKESGGGWYAGIVVA